MRIRSPLKLVSVLAILAYGVTPAGAQTTPSASQTSSASPASVNFQVKTSLTPQEQLTESANLIARMDQAAAGVRRMLEDARKQRDVVRTLCLDDKLSQIDVATRSGRDRRVQLQAAVSRGDAEAANHEFTILTVLRQRVEQLLVESNQCIGVNGAFVGDTTTKMSVAATIPPDGTPYPSSAAANVLSPPLCTSCSN